MTRQAQWYQELARSFEQDPKYWVECLKLAFSEDVGRLMEKRGMNQSDLARRLDTSRAYVTRLFRGNFNPTVETLVKVAMALDARVALHLHPHMSDTAWLDVPRPESTTTSDVRAWADRHAFIPMTSTRESNHVTANTSAA